MFSYLSALLGAFGFGTANIVIKKSLGNLSIPQTLMMSTLSGIGWMFLYLLASRTGFSFRLSDLALAVGLAVFEVCLYLVLYRTLLVSNVTVAIAVSSAYPVLSTVLTVVFWQETLNLAQFGSIGLLVIGAVITSIDWEGVRRDGLDWRDVVRGWPWILATLAIHAVYFPLLGQFTSTGSWESKLFLIKLFSAVVLWIVFVIIRREKVLPPREKIAFTSLLGLLELVGWAGYSWATSTSQGQTAVLIAILNSAAVVTAIWAYFVLGEKLSRWQYAGIALLVVGLTWLGMG
jgi:drug/metabolite transporter (DMT)-like permease